MDRTSHHYHDNTTTSSYSEEEDRQSTMYDQTTTSAPLLLPNDKLVSTNVAPSPIPWGAMYKQLVEFYKEHGHTKVKLVRGKNDRFVTWVRNQKTILGKAKRERASLTATMTERIAKLDEINFDWPKPFSNPPTGTTETTSSSSSQKIKESSNSISMSSKHNKSETSSKKQESVKSSTCSPKTIKIQKALPFKKRNAIPREQEPPIADSSSLSTDDSSGDEVSLHEEDAVVVAVPSSGPTLKKKTVTGDDKEGSTTWDAFYQQLRSFYEKHGHTKVKLFRGENDKFVNWIRNQKTFLGKIRRRPKPLPKTDIKAIRIAKLDLLEFDWPKPIGGAGESHSIGEQETALTPRTELVLEPKHSTVSDEGSHNANNSSLKKRSGSQDMEMSPGKKARTAKNADDSILETVGLDEQNAAKALLCLVGAW